MFSVSLRTSRFPLSRESHSASVWGCAISLAEASVPEVPQHAQPLRDFAVCLKFHCPAQRNFHGRNAWLPQSRKSLNMLCIGCAICARAARFRLSRGSRSTCLASVWGCVISRDTLGLSPGSPSSWLLRPRDLCESRAISQRPGRSLNMFSAGETCHRCLGAAWFG